MNFQNLIKFSFPYYSVIAVFLQLFAVSSYGFEGVSWIKERPPLAAFDPGPDLQNQKVLINHHSEIPNFPGISLQIMRHRFRKGSKGWTSRPTQKFRPAYGPIPWRMVLWPNNVKILFIGQDGTHVAEAAGRPATAGFGGRAQSLAAFFGVEYSAAFINTYAFTIKGQYGARMAPFIYKGKVLTNSTIIPNDVWLMSQDQSSPITQWRNDLIEWIINNNRESLKLIVLFGGSAKDSIASFIESRGGKVGSRWENKMSQVQIPEFFTVNSGGNGEFPIPFNRQGGDAYQSLLGKKLDYKKSGQSDALSYVQKNGSAAIKEMVFSRAGHYKNGLIHHAQLGGYDLNKIWVKKRAVKRILPTRSLKGLVLKQGRPIQSDILVVALPHPTFLSHRMNNRAIEYWEKALKENKTYQKLKAKAGKVPQYKKLNFMNKVLDTLALQDSAYTKKLRRMGYAHGNDKVVALVEKDLAKIRPYASNGWFIPADPSSKNHHNENLFVKGKKFLYGRSNIHNVYYDFGTPKNRMVSRSTARRGAHTQKSQSGKRPKRRNAQIIIFGSRNIPKYDILLMNQVLSQRPNQELNPGEMFTSRPRTMEFRYQFDPGPPQKYARLMKALPHQKLYQTREGMKYKRDGIDTYLIKTHPNIGDFGHYRGTFNHPRVLILADPDGVDDLITARALTGTRGQYLHGLMEDMGVGDQYLVIKTVPFGMDKASEEDWGEVYAITWQWRRKLIEAILDENTPEFIISDGPWAKAVMQEILQEEDLKKFFPINRQGLRNNFGISQVARLLKHRYPGQNWYFRKEMDNIPRSHLPYYAHAWEGTSGDRVIDSLDAVKGGRITRYRGLVFQEVVPNWVVEQKPTLSERSQKAVEAMKSKLLRGGLPLPDESIPAFLERINKGRIQETEESDDAA